MASCSTAMPLHNTRSEKFEFARQESSLSESSDDGCYDDYVSSDFKTLAAKDRKLLEFLPYLETVIPGSIPDIESFFEEMSKGAEQHPAIDEDEEHEIIMAHMEMTARTLENRSFIFKLWLRRILLTGDLEEEQDKNANLQDFEHAIYSAQEVIAEYLFFIYKNKENYNKDELETIFPYYENRLEEACKKTLTEKAKAGFEMSEEDKARGDCPNSRLCSLLGLRLDFLDRLKEMKPKIRDHRPTRDWITKFLWNNFESLSMAEKSSINKDLLVSIGFDPKSPRNPAVETILARAGKRAQHIEACEWAERFINDEFKYNILLCQHSRKFPIKSIQKKKWRFPIHLSSASAEVDEALSSVIITNLEVKESEMSRRTHDLLTDYGLDDEQHPYLFHGTDHESATNILFEGINLRFGRPKRDFSSGSGFYLTKDLDDAVNWSKSTTAKPAILIFKVTNCIDNSRKLSLSENDRQWHAMVNTFRMDNITAREEESLLCAYDFIEGPVATVTRSETSDELVLEPKPSSCQMCLISDELADKFEQSLHSVLFYSIS